MKVLKWFCCLICLTPLSTFADTPWEITGGYSNGNVPSLDNSGGIQEWRAGVGYYPSAWHYDSIYLGGEFAQAYLHSHQEPGHESLYVSSIAPVLRWYAFQTTDFTPYVEASAGPGWLSTTEFATRNLGIHFTFQDFVGVGTVINTTYPLVAGIRLMHYSNAGFDSNNPGITMPVLFYVGCRF